MPESGTEPVGYFAKRLAKAWPHGELDREASSEAGYSIFKSVGSWDEVERLIRGIASDEIDSRT